MLLAGELSALLPTTRMSTGKITKLAEQTEGAEYADGYTLIAMTTHGLRGLRRVVMGSVTEQVLDSTKLPLLIVRPHETEA
jgi:nucleotide-binding universal stress UspA family protein